MGRPLVGLRRHRRLALAGGVRLWRPVLFLWTVMAGEIGLFLIGSTVVTRARPHVQHLQPDLPPTASFLSGHVAGTMCLYGAIAVLVWRATRRAPVRWAAGPEVKRGLPSMMMP